MLTTQRVEITVEALARINSGKVAENTKTKYIKPLTSKGKYPVRKIHHTHVYTEKKMEPGYLKSFTGENNVARILANMFQSYLQGGWYYDEADGMVGMHITHCIKPDMDV